MRALSSQIREPSSQHALSMTHNDLKCTKNHSLLLRLFACISLRIPWALPHGTSNELSFGLKWLDMPVQCSRVLLTGARSSGVRAVAHAKARLMPLALPAPTVRRKHHESAMNSVIGRGVRKCSLCLRHVRTRSHTWTDSAHGSPKCRPMTQLMTLS